ncbi:universal stress protein [Streptomyces sp. SID13666]|uniref:universal stress protein n=1 Tax=Streptomyces sp. SID13666 TaxID=2706054 RepID=UPI0013C29E34|nr:universal stress protein [Streptomyces sp. SID13666]NEA72374.1 universal stress protein [Streptomyces sp. SID13588]
MSGSPIHNRIVVGVDGSESSRAALRWAAAEAVTRRAELVAVHAWEPSGAFLAPYAPRPVGHTPAEERARAGDVLRASVRQALGPRPGVGVRLVLVEGRASPALLAQAQHALLLALGHRVPASRLLPALGPVPRDCVRHSPCPVVTVPAATGRPAPAAEDGPAGPPGRAAWPLSARNAPSEAGDEGAPPAVVLPGSAARVQRETRETPS